MSLFEPLLLNQNNPFDHFRAYLTGNSDSLGCDSNTEMDWKETRDAHIFEIDLPGFTKEDVKLEVKENRVICFKAEKKEQEEDDKKKITWHCRERRNNAMFSREFRLPENAKVDDVKASMHDGVLTIRVTKDETKKKKHKKEVQIFEEDGVAPKGIGRFVCCKA